MTRRDLAAFDADIASDLAWAVRRVPRNLREDAMQEARLHYFLALDRFRPDGGASLRSYTKRRMNGAVRDFMRAQDVLTRNQRRETKAEGSAYEVRHISADILAFVGDGSRSPEALAEAAEAPRLIALTGGRARQVLSRVYVDGDRVAEAARALGISANDAANARNAGLRDIRRAVEKRVALPAAA